MNSYSDLNIFKEAKRLAIEVHKMTLTLPKFEMYEEGSQIRRSSKSVAANIVEAYGKRRYKGEYIKHLTYSHAECDETRLHLDFLQHTNSDLKANADIFDRLRIEYTSLSKQIYKFILWVEQNE
jgi:four helix bundle protein